MGRHKWPNNKLAHGLSDYLPRRFDSPASASYPCILKQAFGEFGKECRIVHSPEEAQKVAPHGLGTRWVMQELIRGRFEVSTTVLVDSGQILDEISSCYEYDSDTYVWPRCRRVSKHLHSVPEEHMLVFQEFLRQYRGICNFNYKVRESGQLSIFELNTRIGGDLAVDAPRDRARALLEKLDEHFNSIRSGEGVGASQVHKDLFGKGSTPEDPTDLSPPDELAQALSLWARHSSGAASRGAQAAAYARRQANIATSLAREAAQKILELDTNECVQNYENEITNLGMAALAKPEEQRPESATVAMDPGQQKFRAFWVCQEDASAGVPVRLVGESDFATFSATEEVHVELDRKVGDELCDEDVDLRSLLSGRAAHRATRVRLTSHRLIWRATAHNCWLALRLDEVASVEPLGGVMRSKRCLLRLQSGLPVYIKGATEAMTDQLIKDAQRALAAAGWKAGSFEVKRQLEELGIAAPGAALCQVSIHGDGKIFLETSMEEQEQQEQEQHEQEQEQEEQG
ncbi:hypothetical protein AK812_SmicGene7139 [Symbiodinium microadriaticum]|uniref:ATP-grasp domain-containing protein n=1 Tax=Symbiodinium microadriaticum TaxID=2951 RepID=A0A1Q9EPI0_SYMMI|nr:hypothetical protein AK812_SmicGene7139 [Symbiodinium microadriaticum]